MSNFSEQIVNKLYFYDIIRQISKFLYVMITPNYIKKEDFLMITKIKKHNNIIKYTQHEINNFRNGKVKIANNRNDVNKFITASIKHSSNSKLYFGKIGSKLADKIKSELGINVENYNISLTTSAVRHILKNHGNIETEKYRGQISITHTDFCLIPQIISNYDKIRKVGITENGNYAIIIEKKRKNTFYLISYISNKKHTLETKTMWKCK